MGSLGAWIAFDAQNVVLQEHYYAGDIKFHRAEMETAFWEQTRIKILWTLIQQTTDSGSCSLLRRTRGTRQVILRREKQKLIESDDNPPINAMQQRISN